ncbi:MAG: DUF177 domain-containing protein [Deltaproteobacteria bacterium]|nr:DUF177 domain-containing protein [Deltaproteobacteria bacterium]
MVEHWITLTNIPTLGREFSFDDQEMWRALWREFRFEAEILVPFAAVLTIVPQSSGFLIQGRLTGSFVTACHRCSEDARVDLDHAFDLFEAHEDVDNIDEGSHLRGSEGSWELNVAALLWEEFLLAVPEKILCSENCLGLCPHCGKNRNLDPCTCDATENQSPLAQALRSVHIKTN